MTEAVEPYIVELERERDGRWIADFTQLPGVMAYGGSRDEALQKASSLALLALRDAGLTSQLVERDAIKLLRLLAGPCPRPKHEGRWVKCGRCFWLELLYAQAPAASALILIVSRGTR